MRNFILLLILLALQVGALAQKVYKTPSGAKYHLATCRMVKNVSEEMTVAEAVKKGLEACKICHPQTVEPLKMNATNKPQGTDKTVQCKGMTKKGNRCLHQTSIGNGYCFQHQP